MLLSYKDALEFIYAQLPMYQRVGSVAFKKDLTNIIELCKVIGNPQERLKCIHIAGTNGKGTVSHIIAGCLQAQGLKVGLYTSPHYKDFRERIKINGCYVPKDYILRFLNDNMTSIQMIKPSFFELTVAMAFDFFVSQKVDIAVIETGLGGRLDSTNIITPMLSVITNISFDHQGMLGDTLEAIASEKAGIIKPHVPVVIGERQQEVVRVFEEKVKQCFTTCTYANYVLEMKNISLSNESDVFDVYVGKKLWMTSLSSPFKGPYQSLNLMTAFCAIYLLQKVMPIDNQAIVDFFPDLINKVRYMGRWQQIQQHPDIILDSAHNVAGIKSFTTWLSRQQYHKVHIVYGTVNDKDITEILKLLPKNATYYFAKANIPRGLDAQDLKFQAAVHGIHGRSYVSVKNAFKAAKRQAKDSDLIYVGGSIFVVGEVL